MIKVQAMFQEKSDALLLVEQAQKKEQEHLRTFQDGYSEGYSDGWDKALENVQVILKRYSIGGCKELKPATKFVKQLSLTEVRAVLAEKSRAGFTKEVKELLIKHGADKLSEINPAEYEALLAEVEVLGNG